MESKRGRPVKYNREELMQALLDWCELPTSLDLGDFCWDYGIDPDLVYKIGKEDACAPTYRMAKAKLGRRRSEALAEGMMDRSEFAPNHRYYDHFYNGHWREEKEFESSLKTKEEGNKPTNVVLNAKPGLRSGLGLRPEAISNSPDNSAE